VGSPGFEIDGSFVFVFGSRIGSKFGSVLANMSVEHGREGGVPPEPLLGPILLLFGIERVILDLSEKL